MTLLPQTHETLVTSHNRVRTGELSFFIPRSFSELPNKAITSQLKSLGTELNMTIPLPSTPNAMKNWPAQRRFEMPGEMRRVLTIPDKFRVSAIPDSEERKIAFQAEQAATEAKPIKIDIGPRSLLTHSGTDLSQLLWDRHIDVYLTNLRSTGHPINVQQLIDSVGETWVVGNGKLPEPYLKILANLSQKEFNPSLSELKSLERQVIRTWDQLQPVFRTFMEKSGFKDWYTARRFIREYHKEMQFDYRNHRIGPIMAEYGYEINTLEESMQKLLKPLSSLGLSELTPQTILDMCALMSSTPDLTRIGESMQIPFTNVVIPKAIFEQAIRRIALELYYNQHYLDESSPIRVMATDVSIFTRGFSRIGMATKFSGAPKVGIIPELEPPILVSSRKDSDTRMYSGQKAESAKPATTILLEHGAHRYQLPLVVTDLPFNDFLQ